MLRAPTSIATAPWSGTSFDERTDRNIVALQPSRHQLSNGTLRSSLSLPSRRTSSDASGAISGDVVRMSPDDRSRPRNGACSAQETLFRSDMLADLPPMPLGTTARSAKQSQAGSRKICLLFLDRAGLDDLALLPPPKRNHIKMLIVSRPRALKSCLCSPIPGFPKTWSCLPTRHAFPCGPQCQSPGRLSRAESP